MVSCYISDQYTYIIQVRHEPSIHIRFSYFLLAAGASPLADMPDAAELASLRLPLTPGGGEDPLTAVTGSASSAT